MRKGFSVVVCNRCRGRVVREPDRLDLAPRAEMVGDGGIQRAAEADGQIRSRLAQRQIRLRQPCPRKLDHIHDLWNTQNALF